VNRLPKTQQMTQQMTAQMAQTIAGRLAADSKDEPAPRKFPPL
jgi:hypothetical protein